MKTECTEVVEVGRDVDTETVGFDGVDESAASVARKQQTLTQTRTRCRKLLPLLSEQPITELQFICPICTGNQSSQIYLFLV